MLSPNKEMYQKQEKTGTRNHDPQRERSKEIPRTVMKGRQDEGLQQARAAGEDWIRRRIYSSGESQRQDRKAAVTVFTPKGMHLVSDVRTQQTDAFLQN